MLSPLLRLISQRAVRLPLLLCITAFLFSTISFAQTVTGSITGTVTDPSNAPIPQVVVQAKNTATGLAYSATTNDSGLYNLRFLPPGPYTLTVENSGFKRSVLGPIQLEVNQTARLDVALQVGQVTETVDVTDVAPVLQAESAATQETISASQATGVPIRGRNFASLTLLVPGSVTPNTGAFDDAGGGSGSGRPFVNGNRQQTNNFLLDGADVNESIDNLVGYSPNVDALSEVKVMTGNMSAEFGNANGAVMNMTLKSGTNEFHGNLFEFLQNDKLNANGFINNRSGVERNAFKRNIFGGTFGGPVIKNRTFFFLDYQGSRQRTSGQSASTVAPAAFRTGDLSALSTVVTDPTTGLAFPNNQIPVSRITNPAALYLLSHSNLYPLPNNSVAGTDALGIRNNYIGTNANYVDNDQADAKIDHRLSDKDTLSGRFTIRRARLAPTQLTLPTDLGTDSTRPTTGGVITWTRTISPAIVNEARVAFNRVRLTDTPYDVTGAFGDNGNALLGIPGGQSVPGITQLSISSREGLSNIGGTGYKSDSITNTFQYSDNLTWQKGRHLLKMGGQAVRYQQNRFYGGNNGVLGQFTYDGTYTGSSWADFLLDDVRNASRGSDSGMWGQRQWRTALFFQDDFKVTPNLTVNLGLRWEYSQPIYEVADRQLNLDINTGAITYAGQNGASRALYKSYWKQFMPRVGFAYTPAIFGDRKTVIRGGYGLTSYLEGTGANLRLPLNPPFFYESQVDYGTTTPGSLTNGFSSLVAQDQLSGTVRAWDPNLRPALIQQYNLSVERQLTNTLSVTAAYVGQTGTHLVDPREGNQALPGTGDINSRRPLYSLYPNVTSVVYTESQARMNYNSGQFSARQRLAKGVEFLASYTYSKAMTDNLGFYGESGVASQSAYWQNAYDRRADYGPAFFDATHVVNLSGTVDMPFGRQRSFGRDWNRVVDSIAGGWTLGYIYSFHTGFPITISSNNFANAGNRADRGNGYRPLNIVNQSPDHWFGTDPSATPCASGVNNGVCAYGQESPLAFGTAGVGTERAPSFHNFDMNVSKQFSITERQYFLFRAEFFNLLNSVAFGPPDSNTSSTSFGYINSQVNQPRAIQFALKYYF